METSLQEQIKKILNLSDFNSEECISEISWINTLISESEIAGLTPIKHLPSQLKSDLQRLQYELKDRN